MSARHIRRVGTIRPSHLMFTGGAGSLIDLPRFSVLVKGHDQWRDAPPEWERIEAPPARLLKAASWLLGRSRNEITELYPPPWRESESRKGNDDPALRVGVSVVPFPGWMRCTVCNALGPFAGGRVFGFENEQHNRPDRAQFFHADCQYGSALAVPARFVLACPAGHLDDFPYREFLHHGAGCPSASHPQLKMHDRGGNIGVNVLLECSSCGLRRPMSDAFGHHGEENLPFCRARHPHLFPEFDAQGCDRAAERTVLVVGASNQWFPQVLSALAVPRTGQGQLDALVEQHWEALEEIADVRMLDFARRYVPALRVFDGRGEQELLAAIEKRRAGLPSSEGPSELGRPDLLGPEWDLFVSLQDTDPTPDFTIRRDPSGPPPVLSGHVADLVRVERLREVRVLVGFTRLDAPDPEDPGLVRRAPLTRLTTSWLPGSEVRGEGIFVRIPERLVAEWERRVSDSEALRAHADAFRRFGEHRYSERIGDARDPMDRWPGARYFALHTLSHLLIQTIAMDCGYNAASLSERVYASREGDASSRAGLLIYTAVPDTEGTLGGLVSLAEPDRFVRLFTRALRGAQHCSSDPLCAERLPKDPEDFLHGAACHVCLFLSETSCERGNRFLDRRFVVPLQGDADGLALYAGLP